MTDENTLSILSRVDVLEAKVVSLEQEVAGLAAAVRGAAASVPAPVQTTGFAYCPRCRGGNALGARVCQWCGETLAPISPSFDQRQPLMGSPREEMPVSPVSSLPPASGTSGPRERTSAVAVQRTASDVVRGTEFWLNKVGIVLFLFGVAFLFKYAVDRQLYNEPARVVTGLALGTLLLIVGLRVRADRRHFSQVLMGGCIATYYITGYASYVLFPVLHVSYLVAFGFMVLVTALAFALGIWQGQALLSIIGLLGGLMTPFVLGIGTVTLPYLVSYTCLLLTAAVSVYAVLPWRRGRGALWRSLLWVSLIGGWLVLLYGALSYIAFRSEVDMGSRWSLQAGAAFMLLAFWALPLIREVLIRGTSTSVSGDILRSPGTSRSSTYDVPLLTVLLPFFVLGVSALVWGSLVSGPMWGWIALAGACLFALVGAALFGVDQRLAYTHFVVALALSTLTASQELQGNALALTLAIMGVALHAIAYRFGGRALSGYGHVLWSLVGIALAYRLTHYEQTNFTTLVINSDTLTDLALCAAGFGVSLLMRWRREGTVYRMAANVAFLLLILREFFWMPYGPEYVLLGWAAYATLLQLGSRWLKDSICAQAAHVIFGASGVLLLGRIAYGLLTVNEDQTAIFNPRGLAGLGVLILGALLWFILRREKTLALYYGVWLHFAFLGWVWQEVGLLSSGNGWVTVVWGAYALGLITLGIRLNRNLPLLYCGISTLLAITAKLFLRDLHDLDAIWRILLFLGFGGVFLGLSYYFQGVLKQPSANEQADSQHRP